MNKSSATTLAAALLVCACAPRAFAQTPAAKGTEAVRERRATPADATKGVPRSRPGTAATGTTAPATSVGSEPQRTPFSKAETPSSKSPLKNDAAMRDDATVKDAATARDDAAAKDDVKDDAAETLPASAAGGGAGARGGADAELDALRAQADSASNPAERGRLRATLAERLAQSGRRAEAFELLRAMLAEERFDPMFFYNTGNALARLGESDAAADAYRKAVAQRHGNYARAQHNLGVVLTRLGRWEEAQDALTAALKLESYTYAEASYSLGRLHALRGESGLAVAEWTRTLRLKPDHADAAVGLARTLADGGDTEQALAVLDSFGTRANRRGTAVPREVAVARGEIVAAANVAATRRAKGADDEPGFMPAAGESRAERDASKSFGATPALPDSTELLREARTPRRTTAAPVVGRQSYALLLSARAARADERGAEAVALYRRAIEAGGGYLAPANLELGLTLVTLRRNEEAAASLLAVVRKEGARYPVVFYHLGRLYEHLGRLGEAGEAFARAAELMGDDSPQFFVDLSRVREREGKSAEALAAAEQYVRLSARAGDVPDWARERVESLRRKATQSAPKKN
jgi:tetratricopeptide (TPR) repeat protein